MDARPRHVWVYTDPEGRQPLVEWLNRLRDPKTRGVIRARIARLETGNFGDCQGVGDGVRELRIHLGPGIRIYLAERADSLLLLSGGSKRTQARDIRFAKACWKEAREAEI